MTPDTDSNLQGPRTDRVVSADARDALERIHGSEVLKSGGVNIIGLDAIRRQLGDRWPAKRSRIWEHMDRELERRLTPHDMFFRLDETNYLIALPLCTRFMAQAACLSIMQDVLKFFLGESNMRDVIVRTVTSVEGGTVASDGLDPHAIVESARASAEAVEQSQAAEHWKPPLAGRVHSLNFQSEARRTVDVKVGVEGVWNLRLGLITSFVLERSVDPEVTTAPDILKVDGAVMGYAVELLQEHRERGGRLTLHVPISYSTFATRQTREKLLALTAPVRDLLRTTVLFEIADLDPGVPPSRLIEVVALLKPFCMGVLARVKPTKAAIAAVKSCGLQGLVLDTHGLGRSSGETKAWMKAFADAAQGGATNFIAHGLASQGLVDVALAAGMTHASRRPTLRLEFEIDAA
ncbi:hypothetical protein BH11PSE2_BH11PSE2_18280 [soil metagenome]